MNKMCVFFFYIHFRSIRFNELNFDRRKYKKKRKKERKLLKFMLEPITIGW